MELQSGRVICSNFAIRQKVTCVWSARPLPALSIDEELVKVQLSLLHLRHLHLPF